MVCKISGNTKRKFNFIARLILFFSGGEDAVNRHETFFYQKVAPHLTDTTFKFPKVFFAGTVPKNSYRFCADLSLESHV